MQPLGCSHLYLVCREPTSSSFNIKLDSIMVAQRLVENKPISPSSSQQIDSKASQTGKIHFSFKYLNRTHFPQKIFMICKQHSFYYLETIFKYISISKERRDRFSLAIIKCWCYSGSVQLRKLCNDNGYCNWLKPYSWQRIHQRIDESWC